jgi:hypothetical protein
MRFLSFDQEPEGILRDGKNGKIRSKYQEGKPWSIPAHEQDPVARQVKCFQGARFPRSHRFLMIDQ